MIQTTFEITFSDDNFAGVNAYTYLQIRIAKTCDSILHCQSREAATDGVILMRLRGTEERHDPVALRLVDDAFIARNGFLHEVQNRLEPLHAYFGIAQTIDEAR